MSFNKFKNNSYCVGGKHYSATTNIRGDITQNKKKQEHLLISVKCPTYHQIQHNKFENLEYFYLLNLRPLKHLLFQFYCIVPDSS